jgi:hypothetical protein
MDKETKTINYNFFHWGPFLYKTSLTKEEIDFVKKLCSKKSKDYRKNLAGLIKHEHEVNVKKLFPILAPYFNSYATSFIEYTGKILGNKIELIQAWVNYMTKFESNPIHTHDEDLSFVIFTQVPKELEKECMESVGNTKPGTINFLCNLEANETLINEHTFFPSVGDFFIFPASLHHYVNSFKCEGERISLSGNLKISK